MHVSNKYLAIKNDKVWACCTSCCDYIEMFNFIDVDWYRENVLKSDRNADDSWTKNIAVKHCEHFLFIIWLQTHRLWWFSESEHSIRGLGRWKKQRDTFNTKLNEYFLHYATTHTHGTLRGRDKDDAPIVVIKTTLLWFCCSGQKGRVLRSTDQPHQLRWKRHLHPRARTARAVLHFH